VFAAAIFIFNAARAGNLSQSSTSQEETGVRILESNSTGIVLELITPGFELELLAEEDLSCQRLSVDEYAATDTSGWPRLPVKGTMLGVPPDVELEVTVLETDLVLVPGRFNICPVSQPDFEFDPDGGLNYFGVKMVPDEGAYSRDAFFPNKSVEIVSSGYIRSQSFATLRMQPFQYNPVRGELRHIKRLVVRLDFLPEDSSSLQAIPKNIDEGSYEGILRETLLNYDQARLWRSAPVSIERNRSMLTPDSQTAYKIMVEEDGIYQVTYAALADAGVPVDTLDPRTFRLHKQDQEVAIYAAGEGDGVFNAGDTLVFYGERINTKYANVNVYWLAWGAGSGLRMASVDGTPSGSGVVPNQFKTTQHLEQDIVYLTNHPSGSGDDRWYWARIRTSDTPPYKEFTTELHNLSTEPISATVRGLLRSFSADPQHHTLVYLNGHLINDAYWSAGAQYTFTVDIPQTYLTEGLNTITVELTSTGGISKQTLFANWFEIDYYDTYVAENDVLQFDGDDAGTLEYQLDGFTSPDVKVFDITEPLSPARILSGTVGSSTPPYQINVEHQIENEHHYLALTPARYLSSTNIILDSTSDLQDPTNRADYIIITHGDFYDQMLALKSLRESQGYRSMLVDVQDVYDEFNGGVVNPQAIHDFLEYAYNNWAQPTPSAVLLVGDGNYDPKDNMGYGEVSYIPPYLADADFWLGETAADNRFVTISGDDRVPDMHLGRLPVKTASEAADVVAKIVSYEQNLPLDGWNMDVMFVADNNDPSAGNFPLLSDDIADNFLPSIYNPDKVYYKYPGYENPISVTNAIIEGINQGRLIVSYIGHASPYWWAGEQLFDTFFRDDIASLTNSDRLSFFVPMTCLDGYFIVPSSESLDISSIGEKVVRASGKGAIASWSPTGLGVASGHDFLEKGLFQAIFQYGVQHVGPATTLAKVYLSNETSGYQDLLNTYILFGDPLTRLHVEEKTFLPLMYK